jgi:hypothetical protein
MSKIKDLVIQNEKEGNVVFASFEGIHSAEMDNFVSQPVEGILYDLNRLPEVVLTYIDDPKWVNDYAVQLVIKKLYSNWRLAEEQLSNLRPRLDAADNLAEAAEYPLLATLDGKKRLDVAVREYRKAGSEAELRESGYGGEG